jgi:hypothetical protein
MKGDNSGIVADGLRRLRRARQYHAVRTRLLLEARRRRAGEMEGASFWRSMGIKWEIEREVGAQLEKEFPSGAFYAVNPRR